MSAFVVRDEREASIDQRADRLAYLVISFGLLALVAYRSFVGHEDSWDLLALVVGAGAVGVAFRAWNRVVTGRWLIVAGASLAVGAALAVAIVLGVGR